MTVVHTYHSAGFNGSGYYPSSSSGPASTTFDVGSICGGPTSDPTVLVLDCAGYNWHSWLDQDIALTAPGWTQLVDPQAEVTTTRFTFNGGKSTIGLWWRRYPNGLPSPGAELLTLDVEAAWTFGDFLTGWPSIEFGFQKLTGAVANPKFATLIKASTASGSPLNGTITPGIPPDPGSDGIVMALGASSGTMTATNATGTPAFTGGSQTSSGMLDLSRLYRTTSAVSAMGTFSASTARCALIAPFSVRGVPERHGWRLGALCFGPRSSGF